MGEFKLDWNAVGFLIAIALLAVGVGNLVFVAMS